MARSRSRWWKGRTEEQALRFAAAVAAIKCTREGGRASFPFRAEVDDFLDQHINNRIDHQNGGTPMTEITSPPWAT